MNEQLRQTLKVNKYWGDASINTFARLWLTGVLIFLPFQNSLAGSRFVENYELLSYLTLIDELTIGIFLFLIAYNIFRRAQSFSHVYLVFLLPITLLGIIGFVSGAANGNELTVTVLGIVDYVKMFLVAFIYASFYKGYDDFKSVLRILLTISVILGLVSLVQEAWATYAHYIMNMDVRDIEYILSDNLMPENSWRFGLYKAPSLINNNNAMAFYSLLMLSIYICFSRKINWVVVIALLSGIIFSASRSGIGALVLLGILFLFKQRKVLLFLVISTMIACTSYVFWDIDVICEKTSICSPGAEPVLNHSEHETLDYSEVEFREFTKEKAVEIWKDHSLLGVGPGMFGGIISIKTNSYIYSQYNFMGAAAKYLVKWGGLDHFWPQVFAELGIFGSFTLIGLFVLLAYVLYVESRAARNKALGGVLIGLLIYLALTFVKTLGSGFNNASIAYTYFALVGIGLSGVEE